MHDRLLGVFVGALDVEIYSIQYRTLFHHQYRQLLEQDCQVIYRRYQGLYLFASQTLCLVKLLLLKHRL